MSAASGTTDRQSFSERSSIQSCDYACQPRAEPRIGSRSLNDLLACLYGGSGTREGSRVDNADRLSVGEPMLGATPIHREVTMTASHAGRPQALPRPACTPAAIRAVLAANADPEVLLRYDTELDRAFVEAREHGDLTPLVQTVRRWWFEADAWRDPDSQRKFLAR